MNENIQDFINLSKSTEPEPDYEPIRGVFTVSQPRKVFHSEEVEINISKLRRWQPSVQINIDRIHEDDE